MKPPRKPTRPSAQGPRRQKADQGGAPARLSPAEKARRIADSWGVAEEKPAKKGRTASTGKNSVNKAGGGRNAADAKHPSRKDGPARPPRSGEAREGLRRSASGAPSRPGSSARGGAGGGSGAYPRPSLHTGTARPRSAAPGPVHRVKAASEPQRIAKLLARAGIASRREIERMIAEGRITLDGSVIDTPATLLTSLNGISVDGQPVAAAEATRLFLFHKPSGCLTAERDPAGRPTIYDRLPAGLPRLMPIGRLDMTTEGLLLLTNDGELKRRLELPSSGIERTYRARAFGDVSQSQLESLIEGIEVDGIRYGRIDANLERRTGRNQWIEMTLTEGKNREVRRVLEHLGLGVNRLMRVRYGPFDLADSQPGDLIEIKRGDLDRFLHYLKERKGRD